jgi:hypothetical protein
MLPVRCRIVLVLLALALATALAAPDAIARDTDKSWEFGAYAMASRYSNSTNFDSAPGFGIRGGYHLKAIHEFEADFDTATADHATDSNIQFDVTKFGASYLRNYMLKGHEKMTPFSTFGLGFVTVDDGTDSESSAVYRAGGGFKYWFTPHVGFRFDARIWRWHGNGDVVVRDPFYSFDATIGVTFLAGGTK